MQLQSNYWKKKKKRKLCASFLYFERKTREIEHFDGDAAVAVAVS